MIDPLSEPRTVQVIFEKSAHPEHIAEYYECDIKIIYEILGLAGKSKNEINRIHQEKNFYNHGYGDHLDFRIERYGQFLKEGDFERFMPYCFMSEYDPRKIIMRIIVNRMKDSDDPVKQRRKNWIVMKFMTYQSDKWGILETENCRLNQLL